MGGWYETENMYAEHTQEIKNRQVALEKKKRALKSNEYFKMKFE